MGAEVAIGLAVLNVASGIAESKAAEEAADIEAQAIEAQAEADINKINRELDEALAMQSAIFGAQGRIMEGSTVAVQEGDIAAAEEDIAAVKKGAELSAQATREAGKTAARSAITGGLLGAAGTLTQKSQVK
jgi:hypothetical protein